MMDKLTRIVSGSIKRRARSLGVPERHQLKIARSSMSNHYDCAGLAILGGPNHYESARIIEQLTGQIVGIAADCTCKRA